VVSPGCSIRFESFCLYGTKQTVLSTSWRDNGPPRANAPWAVVGGCTGSAVVGAVRRGDRVRTRQRERGSLGVALSVAARPPRVRLR